MVDRKIVLKGMKKKTIKEGLIGKVKETVSERDTESFGW